jgi:hypothetical protein
VNYNPQMTPNSALPTALDLLLADIAIGVQLSATDYAKAVDRFDVMRDWIDRESSPLRGMVGLMSPQGSMAIGSTVARVSDRDEYDLDVMVYLNIDPDVDPEAVLGTLHVAIRGEPGSRYYGMTTRHTRCVCVSYADGMHVDLTPAILIPHLPARTSWIFHSKPGDRSVTKERLTANPWGFAQWFNAETPPEADFAKFYEGRSIALDRALGEPVPNQEPAYRKSRALIALQLIKRWRNVRFTAQGRGGLRRPPSILISKLVADNANRTRTLSEEVEHQARQMLILLEAYRNAGSLIHEVNPRCDEDVLTDRWPADHSDQDRMINDLRDFVGKLHVLRTGNKSVAEMSEILEELFGERPTRKALDAHRSRTAPGSNRVEYGTGRVIGAGTTLATLPSTVQPVRGHTFFGDPE